MALTLLEAFRATQRPFSARVLKELVTIDQLISLLPFVAKSGEAFSYTREKSLPSFAFISDSNTTIAESTGSNETITVANRRAVSDFVVPNLAAFTTDAFNDQAVKKFKAAGLVLSDKIINGGNITGHTLSSGTIFTQGGSATTPYVDTLVSTSAYMDSDRDGPGSIRYTHTGTFLAFRAPGDKEYGPNVACAADGSYTLYSVNPSKWIRVTLDVSDATADTEALIRFTSTTYEFDGLEKLVTPGQTRSSSGSNGDALSLTILDELVHSLAAGDPSKRAFVMHSKLVRKYMDLLRAGGGVTMMELASGVKVPEYMGIPILRNDNVACDESKGSGSTLSSVYLLSLGEDEGVYMGALGGEKFDVDADPRNASLMGFRLSSLGQMQTGGDNQGGRIGWYGGLAIGSQKSASRAKEIVSA